MIRKYFQQTKSPIYSFIYVIPLFIIYELGIWLVSSDDLPTVRNGADVLIRNTVAKIGIHGLYGMGLVLLIGMLIAYFMNMRKMGKLKLKSGYFLTMIVESLVWGMLLSMFLSRVNLYLSKEGSNIILQQVVLAVGSGLFEEFLFRLILIGLISIVVGFFIKKNYWYKMSLAIFIAAAIFSYFHFIGQFANGFALNVFLYRLLAGILLGYLYVVRGYGISAYTHSFYNLFILSQISA